ncbi:MAG: MFS transporter [Candidatus Methylophosphatis roskildensis]
MYRFSPKRLATLPEWERILYILVAAQLLSAMAFSNIFPFLPLYIKDLGSSSGLSLELLAGLVYSGQAFSMMIASPIWGSVADRYGRKLMLERALFGGAVLLFLMGYVQSAEQLVLLRFIQGAVTGTIAAANALIAAIAPRERTGYAMGLLQVGSWAGFGVGPLTGGLLADAFGYRAAFLVTGVMLGLAGLLIVFFVKEKFTPVERPARQSGALTGGLLRSYGRILRAPGMPLTYAMRFLSSMGGSMITPVLPIFLLQIMSDPSRVNTLAGVTGGLTYGASSVAAIFLGRLGDRVGHRRILAISALAAGLVYLPQGWVSHTWQLVALQAVAGAASGGLLPSVSALLARYATPGEEGSVYGLDNSVGSAARTVAPLIGAGLVQVSGIPAAFLAAGLVYLLAALLSGRRLLVSPQRGT